MPGGKDDIPSHHNGSRRAMAEAFFGGRLRYEAFPGLAAARKHPDAVAVLDSADERTLAVLPVRLIAADETTLDRLLADLERVVRGLEGGKGPPAHGRVFYEPPDVVSQYMRRVVDGVSLDEELLGMGLEGPVEDVFRGIAPALDPAAVLRIPLMAEWWKAVEKGEVDAARALLDRGVAVDAVDAVGRTALNASARRGDAAMIRLLLDHGADPNAPDQATWTPTTAAAWRAGPPPSGRGDRGPLEMILAAGGRLGLREAVMLDDVDLARTICDRDPSIDVSGVARFHHNDPFLTVAAQYGRLEMARFLLDRGADPERPGGEFGWTALSVASVEGRAEVVALLLDRGADVDASAQPDGGTPLALAAEHDQMEVVRLLIERGARRGLLDAVLLQDEDLVAELLAGSDGSRRPDATLLEQALEHAAAREGVGILRRLLDAAPRAVPASLNDRRLQNLLEVAADSGRLEVARLLVSRGADPRRPDLEDLTPVDRAERAGHAELAAFLAAAGGRA